MGDLDLHVTEGWLRRGYRPINPKTLTAEATETVTASSIEPAIAYRQTYGSTAGKALVTASDFTYMGAFRLPYYTTWPYLDGPVKGPNPVGLGLRRVNGELRALVLGRPDVNATYLAAGCGKRAVFEFRVPTALGANYLTSPVAVQTGFWGPTVHGTTLYEGTTGPMEGTNVGIRGCYWDETTQRLYWNYASQYGGPVESTNACVGSTELTEDGSVGHSTLTPVASWRTGYSFKYSGDFTYGVPQWFAETYLGGGHHLGTAGNSVYSTVTFGPGSHGPTCVTYAPADMATTTPNTALPSARPLLYYQYTGTTATPTADGVCPAPTTDLYPRAKTGWLDGVQYHWSLGPGIYYVDAQGGQCWVDSHPTDPTQGKHGLISFWGIGRGDYKYHCAVDYWGSYDSHMAVIDPADLALVRQGQKLPQAVVPHWEPFTWPHLTYDLTRTLYSMSLAQCNVPGDPQYSPAITLNGGGMLPPGVAGTPYATRAAGARFAQFDAVDRRLYCFAPGIGPVQGEGSGVVFVYQLAA